MAFQEAKGSADSRPMRMSILPAVCLALTMVGPTRSALAQEEGVDPAIDPVAESGEPIVRGLSWDVMAGRIPRSGAIGHGELGFSGLPRLSYHYTLEEGMSVGGLVAFDYATWVPANAFLPSLQIGVPIRYAVYQDESMTIAVRGEPGLLFGFNPGIFGIQAVVGGVIGFDVENRFVVGAGVDFPITIGIHTGGGRRENTTSRDRVFIEMPILIGPVAEFHVTPPLAITLDAKFGPNFDTADKIRFAMRILGGVALRF